ncbi:hypothetical protein M8J77_007394 [Diaphorina citri]|nr:hypothetical protein M8J77_007394 [Diaphorina citri]
MKDGWKEVTDKDDTRVYESLLAQYSPSTELNECSFDMADPGDAVCLLWVQGEPAGFCTLKPKGCWIEELSEQYTMLTLDTIFVLPQYRQKGHVLSLLEELMRRQPGEDLGFSSPISSSMYAGNTVCLMSYAIVFWGFTNIESIFILQKRAVRAVFGLWHWSNGRSVSCKPLFLQHKILTVYAQAILDTLLLIHKLSSSLPRHRNVHQHDTRNRNQILISRNMLMDKSFLKQGITLYNKLPPAVREMREEMFKSTLKEYLLNLAPYSIEEFQGDLVTHVHGQST